MVEGGIGPKPLFPEVLPFLRGKLGNQHVPGHEDDIEHRVVNRLGNLFTLQPDEAEQGRRVPPRSAVQQDAEFGPPRQQPAAALGGGFELGDQQPRVVGPGRLPGELDLFRRRDVEQPAAKLLNLLEQPRVNFLDPLVRGRADPLVHVGHLEAIGAFDGQRQPRRLTDLVELSLVARLQVVDQPQGLLPQLIGIFVGQTGHGGDGSHAVFEGVAPHAGLPLLGFRPAALLGVAAIGFDLGSRGHGCEFSGGVIKENVGEVDPRKAGSLRQAREGAPSTIPVRPLRRTRFPCIDHVVRSGTYG